MKRLMLVLGVLGALVGCAGVGQLARCAFDCAYPAPVPDVPDAGVADAGPCAKKTPALAK